MSACHLKLREWKDAISSATAALDGLDRLELRDAEEEKEKTEDDVEEEIVSTGASKAAPAPSEDEGAKRREDRKRIRAKALMRRGKARSESGGWQDLAGAEEDYKALDRMDNLGAADRKIVRDQLRTLPARTKAAQEKETAEMWGKLKDVSEPRFCFVSPGVVA